MENSGCFPRGKLPATESRYPTDSACWMFQCFHNPPKSGIDCKIFNVHTDANACDCTWGYTDTVRESALTVDSGRKIPCRTGESNLRQRRAGTTLYQLSYIPAWIKVTNYVSLIRPGSRQGEKKPNRFACFVCCQEFCLSGVLFSFIFCQSPSVIQCWV